MKHKLKVGDLILVIDGTVWARRNWVGTIKRVTELYPYTGLEFHYRAADEKGKSYYVNGVAPSSLLKELF